MLFHHLALRDAKGEQVENQIHFLRVHPRQTLYAFLLLLARVLMHSISDTLLQPCGFQYYGTIIAHECRDCPWKLIPLVAGKISSLALTLNNILIMSMPRKVP